MWAPSTVRAPLDALYVIHNIRGHDFASRLRPGEHEALPGFQGAPLRQRDVERVGDRYALACGPGREGVGEHLLRMLELVAVSGDDGATRLRASPSGALVGGTLGEETPEAVLVVRRRLGDVLEQVVGESAADGHVRAGHVRAAAPTGVRVPAAGEAALLVGLPELDSHAATVGRGSENL